MSEKNLIFILKSNLCMQSAVLKITVCVSNYIYHNMGGWFFVDAKWVMYDDDVIEFYAYAKKRLIV